MKKKTKKSPSREKALFIQRLAAFIIDIMLVSTVASLFSVPFIDVEGVNKLNEEATAIVDQYLNQEIDMNDYLSETVSITYQLARKNGIVTIINLFLAILYFVVYQFYQNGQTIGKKLLRIQIISNDEDELTMNQMIFRSLIINSILVEMIVLGFIILASREVYFYGVGIFEGIQYLVMLISVFMVMFREDGRGLHDLIAHTKVVKIEGVKELETCEN